MPSRINMGPDGGPYIAINENSGNIELEDNTGTTVAIWDDATSQWDFQNNPISNVDSLTSKSVNTGTTDSETYLRAGAEVNVWEVLAEDNTDSSGVSLSVSASNLDQYTRLKITTEHAVDNNQSIQMTINGDTSANYDYESPNSTITGASEFVLLDSPNNFSRASGQWVIVQKGARPTIFGNGADRGLGDVPLIRGVYQDTGDISSLSVDLNGNTGGSGGSMKILGELE